MPKFIIERQIPGAGKLTPENLKAISKKSNEVLCTLGSEIQWIHSYVAGDKIYCIYLAANEELIREHAKLGGFPANSITQISNIIDPFTGE
jgi:Nickel responsive protein SCO4226-like